jgi:hypothetical protein
MLSDAKKEMGRLRDQFNNADVKSRNRVLLIVGLVVLMFAVYLVV